MVEIHQSVGLRVMLKVYLSSDHVTPATGKTVAVVISKNGGAFANPDAGATNATELSNGWYYVDLDADDADTLGDLVVRGTASGCDDVERLFVVVKATNRGMTALPDAASGLSAGLPILDPNQRAAVDVKAIDGSTTAATNAKNFWVGAILQTGTAQAGAAGTITLDSSASSSDDFYNGAVVTIISGAGAGQSRQITDYTGSTRVATVDANWVTNPNNTSVYQVIGRIV